MKELNIEDSLADKILRSELLAGQKVQVTLNEEKNGLNFNVI